jgi:hypothetical protein
MIRRAFIALAVVALAVSVSTPAFAGGGSSGGTKANYQVRIKNNGTESLYATVANGTTPATTGAKAIAPNAVGSFFIKPGPYTVGIADAAGIPVGASGEGGNVALKTTKSKVIYVLASQDGTSATVNGAPAGTRF